MKEVEFIGIIERQIYSSENFKMFSVKVDKEKYPFVKFTKYGSVTIAGNLHSLTIEGEYNIKAKEKVGSKGYMYNVVNIRKSKMKSESDCYIFLQEILTFNQASVLYKHYPNIVDLVVNNEDYKVDLSKLKGIKEYTFEKIKNKIIENYALCDLINEFNGVLTMSMLKKLYDKYTSIEKIRTEIRCRPYKTLCGLQRVGFKTADSLLLDMEKNGTMKFESDLRTSKERCLACMIYFLEENEGNGNTKMDLGELRKMIMKLVPKCAHHFISCVKEDEVIYYNKEKMEIALRSTYNTENEISVIIKNALKINNKWDIDWESYREKGEYPLSDEQLSSLELVCNNQISILCGNAGSGKSASTNTLIKMLLDNNKTFTLVASTGRASKVLSSYTGMPASTIHRAYGYKPPNKWMYNNNNKIETDIIIVDEFSMCDIFLFLHLLEGIDFNRTKLLMIGDDAQACSVAAGNCLNDMLSSRVIPTARLTKIFRYGEGGLMTVATDTRNGKTFLKKSNGLVFLGKNRDYAFLQSGNEKIVNDCTELYKKLLTKGYSPQDILVLAGQNKGDYGTIAINKHLQKIANKNYGSTSCMKVGETIYFEGDLVMQMKNDYRAKIYKEDIFDIKEDEELTTICTNGEIGVIKKIVHGYMVVDFEGVLIQYFQSDLEKISLSYSCSIHKSQGGGAKVVILLTPAAHNFINNSNLLYVGLTRTKEKCFHLGDVTTINRCVKKKENLMRDTFLARMLKTE